MTISSIGTTGRDYSTIASWEADTPATLTATWEGECYNDSEFSVAGDVVVFTGFTASATNYVELRAATGEGLFDSASNAPLYNASLGVGLKRTTNYGPAVTISANHVRLKGLQIINTGGDRALDENDSGLSGVIVDSCLIQADSSNDTTRFRSGTMRNCFVIQNGSGGGINCLYTGTLSLYNNTVAKPSDAGGADTGLKFGSSFTAVNNAVFGFTNFADNSFSGSNNCSDVTIGSGTSNQASKTYANQFTTTTEVGLDLRLKSGADCADNGTASGAPSVDAYGQSRSGTTDIGAFELQAASGVTGTGSFTLPSLSFSATGTFPYQAASAFTLPSLTTTAAGTVTFTGTGAFTLPVLTTAATGTFSIGITGTGDFTLPALSTTAAATLTFTGAGAYTLPSLTTDASGTFTAAGSFSGTGNFTLPALTTAATATLTFTGTSSLTLPSLTLSAAGWTTVTGTAGFTLPALSFRAAGETDEDTTQGGGWVPRHQEYRKGERRERGLEWTARDRRAVRRSLERSYGRLMGEPEETPEVAAQQQAVAAVVKPFATASYDTKAPPVAAIDWQALTRDVEAVRCLLALYQRDLQRERARRLAAAAILLLGV